MEHREEQRQEAILAAEAQASEKSAIEAAAAEAAETEAAEVARVAEEAARRGEALQASGMAAGYQQRRCSVNAAQAAVDAQAEAAALLEQQLEQPLE